jgi:hypothetical protein
MPTTQVGRKEGGLIRNLPNKKEMYGGRFNSTSRGRFLKSNWNISGSTCFR